MRYAISAKLARAAFLATLDPGESVTLYYDGYRYYKEGYEPDNSSCIGCFTSENTERDLELSTK